MSAMQIGVNFLHRHPQEETILGVDNKHVIVDQHDWNVVVEFIKNNPEIMRYMFTPSIKLKISVDHGQQL